MHRTRGWFLLGTVLLASCDVGQTAIDAGDARDAGASDAARPEDAGPTEADGAGVDAGPPDAAAPTCSYEHAASTLGRACGWDGECDDGCACNGAERCEARSCVAGPAISCDDGDECTVDSCTLEDGCLHQARDVDGDGYGDVLCGGSDCNDLAPGISPGAAEACDNGVDDDCDGEIDAAQISCRPGDACEVALPLAVAPGAPLTVHGSTLGMGSEYSWCHCEYDCGSYSSWAPLDFVYRLTLDAEHDVTISLPDTSNVAVIALQPFSECGQPFAQNSGTPGHEPPLACVPVPAYSLWQPGPIAWNLPPGEYAVQLSTRVEGDFEFTIDLTDVPDPPTSDVCRDTTVDARTASPERYDHRDDYTVSCSASGGSPDVAYRLVLDRAQDVLIEARMNNTLTGFVGGYAALVSDCADPATTRTCRAAPLWSGSFGMVQRSVPAGTYFVLLEPSMSMVAETVDVDVLTFDPASGAPVAGDTCAAPLDVTSAGASVLAASLMPGQDADPQPGYSAESVDAVFRFALPEARDVDLYPTGPTAGSAMMALQRRCGDASDMTAADRLWGPVVRLRALPAGEHFVVVAGDRTGAAADAVLGLRVETFPVEPPPGNDTCATALDLGSALSVHRVDTLDGLRDDYVDPLCPSCVEAVYSFTLPVSSAVSVSVGPHGYRGLPTVRAELFRACPPPTTPIARGSTFTRALTAGTYFLVVEAGPDEGDFVLDVGVTPM